MVIIPSNRREANTSNSTGNSDWRGSRTPAGQNALPIFHRGISCHNNNNEEATTKWSGHENQQQKTIKI
jgi:hypothetical protein